MSAEYPQEDHGRICFESRNEKYVVFVCDMPGCGFKIGVPTTPGGELKIMNEGNPPGAMHNGRTTDQPMLRGIGMEQKDSFNEYLRSDEFLNLWD